MKKYRLRVSPEGWCRLLAALALLGVCWWFFGGYLPLVPLVAAILATALSVWLLWRCRGTFTARTVLADSVAEDRRISYTVRVEGGRRFLLFPALVWFTVRNDFTGVDRKLSTHCLAEYGNRDGTGAADSSYGFTQSIEVGHYGRVSLEISRARVYDFFQLFYLEVGERRAGQFVITPPLAMSDEEAKALILAHGSEENMAGSPEISSDYEIRDYQPQDSLRDVHWKLSARYDRLIVRKRLTDGMPSVELLFCPTGDARANDGELELFASLGMAFLRQGYPVCMRWWRSTDESFALADAESAEDLERGLEELVCCDATQAPPDIRDRFRAGYPKERPLYVGQGGLERESRKNRFLEWRRRRRQRKKHPDFSLQKPLREKGVPLLDSLAKALMITLLLMGTLDGVLSAFGVSYSRELCILAAFGCAAAISFVYDRAKRGWINLFLIVYFIVYMLVALKSFWAINGGFYTVMNELLSTARSYLGVSNGMEYAVAPENVYAAVTWFGIFYCATESLLFSLHLSRRASLFYGILETIPFYLIPMYFGKTPSLFSAVALFAGYLTMAALHTGQMRGTASRQIRYWLPGFVAISATAALLVVFAVPDWKNGTPFPAPEAKKRSENFVRNLTQYGLGMFWDRGEGSAGMSAGQLSRSGSPMPDYETDLIVEYTPYSYDPVYLKAYVGIEYTGARWNGPGVRESALSPAFSGQGDGTREADAGQGLLFDNTVYDSNFYSRETFRELSGIHESDPEIQGRGVMRVTNVGADWHFLYEPYYTDPKLTQHLSEAEDTDLFVYYPYDGIREIDARGEEPDFRFLEVSEDCVTAVSQICREAGFSGGPMEIAGQVKRFFAEHYAYSLRPGRIWGNADYISWFLQRSKKGYCMHFASAATMLFRYLGIPARYVEGYAFSYTDMVLEGELVADADYKEYYQGYSALGETGLVRLEIPDAWAHAWVEIYVEGKGWITVDPTPAAEEEEQSSFWEDFGAGLGGAGGTGGLLGEAGGELLRKTAGRVALVLIAAGGGFVLALAGRRAREAYRRRRLSVRKQIEDGYRRLWNRVGAGRTEAEGCITIHEQLRFLAGRSKRPPDEETLVRLETALYDAFYGAEFDGERGRELCLWIRRFR